MIQSGHRRLAGTALAAALLFPPPGGRWLGADKVKHFLLSALVQSTAFSLARSLRADRATSQAAGAVGSAATGVWKEVHDRKAGRPFSAPDLVWDAAGAASMAALLNRTR